MLVNGILRVGGRLERARISYGNKHPITLHNNLHLTNLFIRKHHLEVGHSGAGHTWTSLRQEYWIVKGSSAVCLVINNCIFCKKRNALACKQLTADLRSTLLFSRSVVLRALTCETSPQSSQDYGCLFTCLTMQAIHIEIAHGLDTNLFLNALRRFNAVDRIQPIYTATTKQILLALNVSCSNLDQRKIKEFFSLRNINWHLNPPNSSHMGGAWERMIRSVRRILSITFKGQILMDDILQTIIIHERWFQSL